MHDTGEPNICMCKRSSSEQLERAMHVGAHSHMPSLSSCTYADEHTHAGMLDVRNMFMCKCMQVAEKEISLSTDDADERSSYGSGHSDEGYLETATLAVPANGIDDVPTLIAGVAALARGQAIVLAKLSFLEQIVGTVQFDMTWVRDDMKSVHMSMDRFADYVCDVQDEAVEAQRLREQVSLEGSERQLWKGKEHVADYTRAPSASTSRGEGQPWLQGVPESNVCRPEGGKIVEEPQPYVNNSNSHANPPVIAETGRRDWGFEGDESPEFGSPPCQQKRVSTEREPPWEESQQFEMSCQSTQLPTPVPARSMWQDFAAAVRDWPEPIIPGNDREEGWVRAKKARLDLTEYGKNSVDAGSGQGMGDHGTLNLNCMPEKLRPADHLQGEEEAAVSIAITGASKNGGGGTWRGSAKPGRPPAVQPRYHASVRVSLKATQRGCDCCFVHGPRCALRYTMFVNPCIRSS